MPPSHLSVPGPDRKVEDTRNGPESTVKRLGVYEIDISPLVSWNSQLNF